MIARFIPGNPLFEQQRQDTAMTGSSSSEQFLRFRALSISILLCLLTLSCGLEREESTLIDTTPAGKRIALSFDDAPRGQGPRYTGQERTDRLIRALQQARAPQAVFFVTPRDFEREGGLKRVLQYAEAGHLVANHSNTHPWLSRSDAEDYLRDIDDAEAQLINLPNHRPLFRYPYLDEGRGQPRQQIVAAGLKARGFSNGYVTVDNYDWYLELKWQQAVKAGLVVDEKALGQAYVEILMSAVRFYDELAVTHLGRSPAHVLLLHENDLAAQFIGDLVVALRADGWTLISPDQAYDDPIAGRIPVTLKTGQGRVAALAIDAGADPKTLTHLALEEKLIDQYLDRHHVFSKPDTGQ